MAIANILTGFSRLSLYAIRQSTIRNITTTNNDSPLYFKATNILFGEPLKKKKRIDPAVIRHREERKRKKIEKQIRRLEKHARQFKPIEEVEVPFKLIDEKTKRTREIVHLSPDTIEKRELLNKKWCKYKLHEYLRDVQTINTILLSQKKALEELKAESNTLYQAAIEIDTTLVSHCSNGPSAIVNTPAIHNYSYPDGNYVNITPKFDGEKLIN